MDQRSHQRVAWFREALNDLGRGNISSLGMKVAEILDQAWGGIGHLSKETLHKRVDWSDEWKIEIVVQGNLTTCSDNKLTDLVILCHEHKVLLRVAGASSWGHLKLTFFERGKPGFESMSCPSIDDQLERVRGQMRERSIYEGSSASDLNQP